MATAVDTEGTAFGLLGMVLHLRGGTGQFPEMGEAAVVGSGHANVYSDEREETRYPVAVHRRDPSALAVLGVIEGWNDLIECFKNLLAGLLDTSRFHDEDEIIAADVANESALGLQVLDDVQDESPGDLDNFVPPAETVLVVEGFKIGEIRVG